MNRLLFILGLIISLALSSTSKIPKNPAKNEKKDLEIVDYYSAVICSIPSLHGPFIEAADKIMREDNPKTMHSRKYLMLYFAMKILLSRSGRQETFIRDMSVPLKMEMFELWDDFVLGQEESIRDIISIKLITEAIEEETGKVLKVKGFIKSYLSVPLVYGNIYSISQFVQNGFLDPLSAAKVFNGRSANNSDYFVKIKRSLVNHPKVLTFRIERYGEYEQFNESPLHVDKEIVVNGVPYILTGKIAYDPIVRTYNAIALDPKCSLYYSYNKDGSVIEIKMDEPQFADKRSILLFYSEKALLSTISDDLVVPESLVNALALRTFQFPRKVGVKASKEDSNVSALISALYSIPALHSAYNCGTNPLYQPILNLLSSIIHRITTSNVPVNANARFLSCLKKTLGMKQDEALPKVDILWNNFMNLQKNESARKLCQIEISNSIVATADDSIFKSKAEQMFALSVPVKEGELFSTAEFVENGFINPGNSNKILMIKRADGTEASAKFKRTLQNYPQVLTMRIERFGNEKNFKADSIYIDNEIIIDSKKYILAAKIEYDPVDDSYQTVALDFGNLCHYRYTCDGEINRISNMEQRQLDHNSVLLFYVQEEEKNLKRKLIVIEDELMESEEPSRKRQTPSPTTSNHSTETTVDVTSSNDDFASTNFDFTSFDDDFTNFNFVSTSSNYDLDDKIQPPSTSFDIHRKLAQIYTPVYSNYGPEYSQIFKNAEEQIRQRLGKWSIETLNVFSKYIYGTYPLNSESYSFKQDKPFPALEVILGALASNKKACKKLFEIALQPQAPIIEQKMALIVAKMMIGCKQIPLDSLVEAINQNSQVLKDQVRSYHVANMNEEIKNIQELLDDRLFSVPKLKCVVYDDFEQDIPKNIVENRPVRPVILDKILPPKPASIKGIWFDTLFKGSRSRNIFQFANPEEESIFSLEVCRWRQDRYEKYSFFPGEFNFQGDDYYAAGFVALGESDPNFTVLFIDTLSHRIKVVVLGGESYYIPLNHENYLIFQEKMKKQSIQVFFGEKIEQQAPETNNRFIPKEIFTLILKDLSSNNKK